ncbi:bulb-type lectin domain-containing protein [Chryseobacterium sp. CT-SW4]|uniref:bulb-type lectin domain-containing protein n=1 Tax=Chryseobacterium sp. SW-1 TaxID=3157343 RepID=UPI003B01D362
MKKSLLALLIFGSLYLGAQNISAGQTLQQDRKYWSSNRQYYLIFQNDGNLVFYDRRGSSLWDSGTSNQGSKAIFQDDGNLVVYSSSNRALFSSNTNTRRGKLNVQDDGNLVIYDGSNALWASQNTKKSSSHNSRGQGNINPGYEFSRNTKVYSANSRYYLIFQNDGNLVLSSSNGSPIWSTETNNKGSKAQFQNDGNLVVYDSYNRAVWSSKTSNRGGNKLTVQDDGNLVIYNNSSPVWSSDTQRRW